VSNEDGVKMKKNVENEEAIVAHTKKKELRNRKFSSVLAFYFIEVSLIYTYTKHCIRSRSTN
jgi:hypothetical protein